MIAGNFTHPLLTTKLRVMAGAFLTPQYEFRQTNSIKHWTMPLEDGVTPHVVAAIPPVLKLLAVVTPLSVLRSFKLNKAGFHNITIVTT